MSKEIEKNNLYYIRDSYIVKYKGADENVRPYFCFSRNKNFSLVFPITSKMGNSNSSFKEYRYLKMYQKFR